MASEPERAEPIAWRDGGVRPRRRELSEGEVRCVRVLLADGYTPEAVANETGWSVRQVRQIRSGYTYSLVGLLAGRSDD